MLWVALVCSQLYFGFQLTYFLLQSVICTYAIMSIGIPIGFGLSTLIFYLCSFYLRFSKFNLLVHTSALFVGGFIIRLRNMKKTKERFLIPKPTIINIIFISVSIVLSFYFTPRMYFKEFGSCNSLIEKDFTEEFALTNSFYQGVNSGFVNIFKIRNPICYKCHSYSKWLTAVHSAMLKIGFASDKIAFLVPSFLMFFSICYQMLYLSHIYLKGKFLPILTLILFLFSGGYGFWSWFEKEPRNDKNLNFVSENGKYRTQWLHPILQYIFAHRPSQLSLSCVLAVMIVLSLKNISMNEMIFIGIVTGLLPAIQHQVFFCMVIYLIVYFLLRFPYQNKKEWLNYQKQILILLISFGVVGAFPLLHYIPRSNRLSLIRRKTFSHEVMLQGSYFPNLQVWYEALGVLPFISIFLGWFYVGKKLKPLYISSFVIFIIGNLFTFQFINAQNVFVFYPFWMTISSIVIIKIFYNISKRIKNAELKGFVIGILSLIYVLSLVSTLLGFKRLKDSQKQIFDQEKFDVAKWIADNTPIKSVFVTTNSNYDTVAVLGGKQSFVVSNAIANSVGFDASDKEKELNNLLANQNNKDIAPKVLYALNCVGENERMIKEGSDWKEVYSSKNMKLYKRNI